MAKKENLNYGRIEARFNGNFGFLDLRKKRILDVGCGDGTFAHFVACRFGCEVVAVDSYEEKIHKDGKQLGTNRMLAENLKDGVEIVEPLFDTAYGTRKFTIRDLDGNELGFVKG